jgi:hypothetical protein
MESPERVLELNERISEAHSGLIYTSYSTHY